MAFAELPVFGQNPPLGAVHLFDNSQILAIPTTCYKPCLRRQTRPADNSTGTSEPRDASASVSPVRRYSGQATYVR